MPDGERDRSLALTAWQESWDQVMARYQPNRDQGVTAVFDLVDAAGNGGAPRLLDLGGGTGSVCHRALTRWPQADLTLLDLDPVLMAVARASLPPAVELVQADLRSPEWTASLPHRDYDAVLAVMALHYLPPHRLTQLYAEVIDVLRPGGVLVVMDHMPDPGLPALSQRLADRTRATRPDGPDWTDWWASAEADPILGPASAERAALFRDQHSAEWTPPVSWHMQILGDCGYAEAGLGWRHGTHAAVVALAQVNAAGVSGAPDP